MLEGVGCSHPGVLPHLAPEAFCTGLGDSAINFELHVGTDDSAARFRTRSELSVAAYHAVLAAGMSFPFPQREVRLLPGGPENPGATVRE